MSDTFDICPHDVLRSRCWECRALAAESALAECREARDEYRREWEAACERDRAREPEAKLLRDRVAELLAELAECRAEVAADRDSETIRAAAEQHKAEAGRLREVFRRYVETHGPTADHHKDDCPDPDNCGSCELDADVNVALSAPAPDRAEGEEKRRDAPR